MLARHRDSLIADLAIQVHARPRLFVNRRTDLILREASFYRRPNRVLGTKKSVRRDQPISTLMRAKKVVVRNPVPETLARIRQIHRLRTRPELALDGLPQSLALSKRLRMMSTAHNVIDPLANQDLLKPRLSTPRVVLAALIRQDFVGPAEAPEAIEKSFSHQLRLLMACQCPRHNEATVIVQKDCQIHAPRIARRRSSGVKWRPAFRACARPLEAPLRQAQREDIETPDAAENAVSVCSEFWKHCRTWNRCSAE